MVTRIFFEVVSQIQVNKKERSTSKGTVLVVDKRRTIARTRVDEHDGGLPAVQRQGSAGRVREGGVLGFSPSPPNTADLFSPNLF